MALPKQDFSGVAVHTTLTSGISNADTTIPVVSTAGYPSNGDPFVITVDRSLAPGDGKPEEKIRVSGTYTPTSLTALNRGYDGTTAQNHSTGASVEHTVDAAFLRDVSVKTNAITTIGDIPVQSDTAGSWGRIAATTAGKVLGLILSGGHNIPAWVDGLQNLFTTRGDVVVAGASAVPQRLGLGASGTLLQSNGTDLVYGPDTVEATARAAADSSEAATRAAADSTNASAITTETSRATAAEALLAPSNSPTFTGHPVGVTETAGTNSTRLATTAYADAAVAAARELTPTAKVANYTAVDRDLVEMTNGGTARTVTLPAPSTSKQTIGVISVDGTGAIPTTVSTPSGNILGVGVAASATSILLGAAGAFVVLKSDGTNWNIVAGAQDSGWINLTFATFFSAGSNTPKYRLVGNVVRLTGSVAVAGGFVGPGTGFTMPAGYRPALPYGPVALWPAGGPSTPVSIAANGVATFQNAVSGIGNVYLDPITFTVD